MTLVCGGGGLWGIAWMTGLAAGLADAGIDLRDASTIVGTSAGSVVGARLASGLVASDLFDREVDASKQPREVAAAPGRLEALLELSTRPWPSERDRLRAIAELALTTETEPEADRRRSIADRLAPLSDGWPDKRLLVTAFDLDTLDLAVLDASSGVSLTDAVAASCAVPGVWPPVQIAGKRYVDGGTWRTPENAHLAEGAAAVLVLAPMANMRVGEPDPLPGLAEDVARLEAGGADVVVIGADEASLTTMTSSLLDPATRGPAARAGRRQGAREAKRVRPLFERA